MRKLSAVVAVVVALLSLTPPRMGRTEGTETLGPPAVPVVAHASGIAVGGTGLFTLPAAITLDLPADARVRQVLLYWEGEFQGGGAGGDTIDVNGRDIRGSLVGGPSRFFPQTSGDVLSSSYRADVTGLDIVGPGSNRVTIGGLGYNYRNDGAGLLVLYDDGTPAKDIQILDGNDNAYFEFAPPLDTTAPQTFTFEADTVERTATLALMVGSVGHERPNAALITAGGETTRRVNVLSDNTGDEWDALTIPITIPAGATTATVQLLSEGDGSDHRPASLSWVMSGLALAPSSAVSPTGQSGPAFPAGLANIAVVVEKTNDANGDGAFTKDETAPVPGANVIFRVRLTNPTATPVVIGALTDTFSGIVLDLLGATGGRLLANTCGGLAGQILPAGSGTLASGMPASCTFTVSGFSPPANSSLLDTVGVRVSEVGNPENVSGAFDTSVVRSPAQRPPLALPRVGVESPAGVSPPVSSEAAAPQQAEVENQAGERLRELARTGAAILLFALVGCGLIATGMSLLRSSRGGRATRT